MGHQVGGLPMFQAANVFSMKDASYALDGAGALIVTVAASFGLISMDGIVANNQATCCGFQISGHDIIVTGNTFDSWGAAAAIVVSADPDTYNVTISHNDIHGASGGGTLSCMEIWGARSVVANNHIHEGPGAGFDIGGQNSIITGNMIWGNGVANSNVGIGIRYCPAPRITPPAHT